jgi:hypothetical protein
MADSSVLASAVPILWRANKEIKNLPRAHFHTHPHLLRSSKLTRASFSSTRMSGLPKSKRAKPAKAEPAMPEATKAELTKADLANADLTSPPEAISITPDKIEFSPAIPWPAPFDVQKRIQELHGYLDPKNPWYEFEQQHVNIKAVIQLYEDGIIDGSEEVFIMQGKIVTEEETLEANTWAWIEVYSFKCLPRTYLTNGPKLQGMGYEFAEKHAYGHGAFNTYHEVRNQAPFWCSSSKFRLFQIRMLVRLIPQQGGDGTVHRINVINDTGSCLLTLFDTDISFLGNLQGYTGWRGDVTVRNASGTINRYRRLRVQIQLVRDDYSPWSNWINEYAAIKPASQGVPRLSGNGIRRVLYLGTAPGNHLLAVAATKGGMASLLLKHATAERKRGNRYPLYLDAIKSALRRHQKLKKLVRFNLSEGPCSFLSWSSG